MFLTSLQSRKQETPNATEFSTNHVNFSTPISRHHWFQHNQLQTHETTWKRQMLNYLLKVTNTINKDTPKKVTKKINKDP